MTGCPTILIVDDETQIVALFAEVLRRAGYRVCEAHGLRGAVEHCRKEDAIDLVLSGFNLRAQTGLRLSAQLRRVRPNLEIVFMTSNPDTFDELVSKGFACLRKPFSFAELLETIQERLKTVSEHVAGSPPTS